MDLKHDWRTLHEVLYTDLPATKRTTQHAVLLEGLNGQAGVGVTSEGKLIKTESGNTIEQLEKLLTQEKIPSSDVIQYRDLHQWIEHVSDFGANTYQQLQAIRTNIQSQKQQGPLQTKDHFFIRLFSAKLRRILPTRFNVVLFIDQRSSHSRFIEANDSASGMVKDQSPHALLLSFVNGKLDQFFEPDFSSLHSERLFDWQNDQKEIGKYLENRYLLPCGVVFMYQDVWQQMLKDSVQTKGHPWRTFVRHLDQGKAALFPKPFYVQLLLAMQRVMVYFGHL